MKRFTTLLLLAALLLSSVACGTESTDNKDTSSSDDTTASDTVVDDGSRDSVPSAITEKLDFGEKTVTVLTRDTEEFISEIYVLEETADTMNDAVYARNRKVEEQMNITIDVISRAGDYASRNDFNSSVVREVMAGTTEFDVISYYAYSMPEIAVQNVLYNLNDLNYLDLSKPWWHQMFIENAEVYGKLYAVSGDINLSTVSYRMAMFFNKDLVDSYLPDVDLYQTVLDGKWTQEYLIGLTKDIYQDLNGNDQKDAEDFFGLDINGMLDPFPVGGGITYTKKTSDGGYEWDLFNDRNNTIIERFYDAYNANNGIFFIDSYDETRFIEGREIFTSGKLSTTEKLRDMDADYGILPTPKYDEEQEKYYSLANDNYSQIAVPATCEDPDMVGAFLELMGEYSYKMVTPKYYEVAMKGKYLRDDESCQMFDIIIDGAWYDFANINTSVVGNPVFITRQSQYHKDGKNFASFWAANESSLTASLNELLEIYKNNS